MSGKVLVIVESPTKARTIKRFLPSNYMVEASIGHIRDLPQSAADIPKKYKGEEWAKLGIDVDHDFKPLYVMPKGKSKIIREIKSKMKEADLLLLATDEDREGESISWHLIDQLKPKIPYKRMVFHEITKKAIHQALESGREIDENLVNAQETRRILDRLYGYTLSPLLWKKIAFGLSAGRVQSPGLRLIVSRERERLQFLSSTYWDAKAKLCKCSEASSSDYSFDAKLESVDGIKVAGSKDFNSVTGKFNTNSSVLRLNEQQTNDLLQEIRTMEWIVGDIQEKKNRTKPAQPFTTSTLQQEGNRKLRLSTRETMRIAQRLYENGFITYMRTDSPALSDEGMSAARHAVEVSFGKEYLTASPRTFSASTKGAQEAHEAIRPAGEVCRHPDSTGLDGKELSLYTLIWKRTLASQMAEAEKALTTVKVDAGKARFTATGTRIVFPGFLRVYVEGTDDPEAALDNKETILPDMKPGLKLKLEALDSVKHETKPPNRFTEASLVKELENLGIGRPSTYAAIINTLFERKYVRTQGTALNPTFIGFGVIQLLEKNFPELIKYSFTAEMENALDEISLGKIDRLKYLKGFYSGAKGLKKSVDIQEKEIKPADSRTIKLPQITLVDGIRIGKFGPYILCIDEETGEELHASIPEDITPAEITDEDVKKLISLQKIGPEPIGFEPVSGLPVYYMIGRYGPYFQLGAKTDENPKPRRASIPNGKNHEEMSIEEISLLLSLPRELGNHPETKKPVIANNGRFGPYVGHEKEFRSLKKEDNVYEVTLERALEILAAPKRGKNGSAVIKDFGKSRSGEPIALYSGRYGVYLKHGKSNIALPEKYKKDETEAQKLTLEDVNKLL